MIYERRKFPRVRVTLPARWEGALHQENATVTDISRTGCFILSGGSVQEKELIWLEIKLANDDPLQFWCEVVSTAQEIGFAVRFNSSSPEHAERLAKYIDHVLVTQPKQKL